VLIIFIVLYLRHYYSLLIMKNKLNLFLYFFLVVHILSSCVNSHSHNSSLMRVDSLLCSNPKEALKLLKRINPSILSSKEERAYYGLLLVQATDKAELTILPCDSLVDVALDYYTKGSDKAKALFYKGRILIEMGHEKEALKCYYSALSELKDSYADIRIKGMIYEDLGKLDLDHSLYKNALEKIDHSFTSYSSINDNVAMINALRLKGMVYKMQKRVKRVYEVLNLALKIGLRTKDSLVISGIYQSLSLADESDSALFYAHKALDYFPTNRKVPSNYYSSIGSLLLDRGKKDSASYYFNKSLGGGIKEQALAHGYLSDLEKVNGNYKEAFRHLEKYSNFIDSLYVTDKSSKIEQLGYKYEAEARVAKHKAKMQQANTLIITVSIILILALILILQNVNRHKKVAKLIFEQRAKEMEREMASLQNRIDGTKELIARLKQEKQISDAELSLKEQEIKSLFLQKTALRNTIFFQSPIYKKIEKLSAQVAEQQKEIKVLTLTEQDILRKLVFEIYSEYIDYLHTQYPKMTEDDFLFSCLETAGLNTFTIALCFGNSNKQIINQRRYRLKSRMIPEE
jgi:tetratricopeptide (TPR) repeat protein